VVFTCPSGDHSIISCVIKGGVKKAPSRIIEYRSYKRYGKDAFINEPDEVNWYLIDDIPDIDTAASAWSSLFTDVADRHAPIKKLRVKGSSAPWLTPELPPTCTNVNFITAKQADHTLLPCGKELRNSSRQ